MAQTTFLALLLCLSLTQANLTAGRDLGVDPGRITWWIEDWASQPIKSSKTNGSSEDVTLTFKFRPSTTIEEGYVEVVFPSSILADTAESSNIWVSEPMSIKGGKDTQIEVKGVDLPGAAGGYGPFGLRTRAYKGGQIVDWNATFGNLYVSKPLGDPLPLTITPYSQQQADINSDVLLNFRFNIREDLWRNDVFVIYTDDDWQISEKPSCESTDIVNSTDNYFVATDNTHRLQCVSDTEANMLFIYGLAVDIDVSELGSENNSLDIQLKIKSYQSPNADYPTSQYNWNLEIWRVGTTDAIQNYYGQGPDTIYGSMAIDNWRPYNGYQESKIVQGMTMYTTVTIVLNNTIPSTGKLDVLFTNVTIDTPFWKLDTALVGVGGTQGYCFVEYIGTQWECIVNSGKAQITFTDAVLEDTRITLTTLTNFSGANPAVSAISYNSVDGDTIIDVSNSENIYYANSGVNRLSDFGLIFADDNGANAVDFTGITQDKRISAYIRVREATFTSSTEVDFKIRLPIARQLSDFAVFVNQDKSQTQDPLIVRYLLQSSTPASIAAAFTGVSAEAKAKGLVGTNTLGTPRDINLGTGYNGISMQFSNQFDDSTTNLNLPRVASNLKTRYESWAVATIGTIEYVKFQILSFTSGTTAANRGVQVENTNYCGKVNLVKFTPAYSQDFSNNKNEYYIDFTLSVANGGSGLSVGDSYPFTLVDTHNLSENIQAMLLDANTIRITNSSSLVSGTPYSIFLSLEGDVTVVQFSFRPKSGNPKESYNYILAKSDTVAASATTNNSNNLNGGTGQDFDINTTIPQLQFTYGSTFVDSTLATDYVTFTFPPGFSFTDSLGITFNGVQIQDLKTIYSDDIDFKIPSIIGKLDGAYAVGAASHQIRLTGVTTSRYEQLDFKAGLQLGIHTSCLQPNQTYNVNRGTINKITSTPAQVIGRGPQAFQYTMQVIFTTQSGIPDNGKITIKLDTRWRVLGDCEVENLTPLVSGGSVSCEKQTDVWEITGFQGFDNSLAISVSFSNCLSPVNVETSSLNTGHVDEIKTYAYISGSYVIIDEKLDISDETCQVESALAAGFSTFAENVVFPPNAGEKEADVYMRFTLSQKVPSGAVLNLYSAYGDWTVPSFNTQNYVYCSHQYSSISLTGNKLALVLQQNIETTDQVEFYLEKAQTNPDNNNAAYYYTVQVVYNTVTLIQDSLSNRSNQSQLVVTDAITGTISGTRSNPVILDIYTAGELADYTFHFKSSEVFETGDKFMVRFPREFDVFLGDNEIKYQWYKPTTHYLGCSSPELRGFIECTADRRFLRVFGGLLTQADTNITITFEDVRNPANNGTNSTEDFEIYHLDKDDNIKAKNRMLPGAALVKQAPGISIRSIDVSNRKLFERANYTFEFYTELTLSQGQSIVLYLPQQYELYLNRGNQSIRCSLSWVDQDTPINDFSEQVIMSETDCRTEFNFIVLDLENVNLQVDYQSRLIFRVFNLRNPEFGLQRVQEKEFTWDFDINDSNVFTLHDLWTEQFRIFVYDNQNFKYDAASYLNNNIAYTGLENKERQFYVNGYNPASKANRIKLIPGGQTQDILITTESQLEGLAAKQIEFKPYVNPFTAPIGNNQLTFTSSVKFEMYHQEKQIPFRVSASANLTPGIYYINWETEESLQKTLKESQYNPPAKTLIEVAPAEKSQYTMGSIPDLPVGTTSPPIPITFKYAPNTELSVIITPADDSQKYIQIMPSAIIFEPEKNTKHFVVIVGSDFEFINEETTSQMIELKALMTGTDESAFQKIENFSVNITLASTAPTSQPKIDLVAEQQVTRNSAKIEALSDADGYYIFYMGTKGVQAESRASLEKMIGDVFELDEELPEVEEEEEEETEVEPSQDDEDNERLEGWVQFQRRLYKQHLKKTWWAVGLSRKNELVDLVSLTNLYAETSYESWTFVQNISGIWSDAFYLLFNTQAMPEAIGVKVSFEGEVTANKAEQIKDLAAAAMGVAPSSLFAYKRSTSRRLNTNVEVSIISKTEYEWTMGPNRSLNLPTPTQEGALTVNQYNWFKEQIEGIGVTFTPTFEYKIISRSGYLNPNWTDGGEPSLSKISSTTVTITLQSNQVGEICCIASRNQDINPTADQILLGLDQENSDAKYECVNYTDIGTGTTVRISGLMPITSYKAYCMAYNSYPLWPMSIVLDDEIGVESFQFVTESTQTVLDDLSDDDFAEMGRLWVLGIIMILVQ